MKTIKFRAIFAAMILIQSFNSLTAQTSIVPHSYTVPTFEVRIDRDSSEEKFILTISNPQQERLDIRLSSGAAGFQDGTRETEYRKRISLEGAGDGQYVLTVRGSGRTVTRTISLQTKTEVTRRVNF